MDDKHRIALVETRTQGDDGSLPQLIRYQFGNHLGSASLDLDHQAQVISYEEYYPYGSTSYQAVRSQTETAKRYRYTGMERDEETGLNYHSARYYSLWIARWMSVDPEQVASLNVSPFCYTVGNPIRLKDWNGRNPGGEEAEAARLITQMQENTRAMQQGWGRLRPLLRNAMQQGLRFESLEGIVRGLQSHSEMRVLTATEVNILESSRELSRLQREGSQLMSRAHTLGQEIQAVQATQTSSVQTAPGRRVGASTRETLEAARSNLSEATQSYRSGQGRVQAAIQRLIDRFRPQAPRPPEGQGGVRRFLNRLRGRTQGPPPGLPPGTTPVLPPSGETSGGQSLQRSALRTGQGRLFGGGLVRGAGTVFILTELATSPSELSSQEAVSETERNLVELSVGYVATRVILRIVPRPILVVAGFGLFFQGGGR